MDIKSAHVDLTTLTAIVSDSGLDEAVKALREADLKVINLQTELHDAEVEASLLRAKTLKEAHEVLHSDPNIAYDYAHEAWVRG